MARFARGSSPAAMATPNGMQLAGVPQPASGGSGWVQPTPPSAALAPAASVGAPTLPAGFDAEIAGGLFGRGIGCRSIRDSNFGNFRAVKPFYMLFFNQFSQPKIKNFNLSGFGDHYISGFDVAVNNISFVRVGERVTNLYGNAQSTF